MGERAVGGGGLGKRSLGGRDCHAGGVHPSPSRRVFRNGVNPLFRDREALLQMEISLIDVNAFTKRLTSIWFSELLRSLLEFFFF